MRKILLLLLLATATVLSCKKESSNDIAQNPVNFTLSLNDPSNLSLNAVGGILYLNEGTKGIIIYRRAISEFNAIERNCPYDPNASCSLIQIQSGITSIDSCCGSKFSIYDGSVINGPAATPLYFYYTQYDDLNKTLHIYK